MHISQTSIPTMSHDPKVLQHITGSISYLHLSPVQRNSNAGPDILNAPHLPPTKLSKRNQQELTFSLSQTPVS
jgi:hypothetical protein